MKHVTNCDPNGRPKARESLMVRIFQALFEIPQEYLDQICGAISRRLFAV